MGTFIPHLSHQTEPLRSMLKQDNVFTWDEVKTRSFQQIKSLILKANETPLHYYDSLKPVIVQADASLRGLGACLIQDESANCLCLKVSYRCRELVRQHRERATGHCVRLPEV